MTEEKGQKLKQRHLAAEQRRKEKEKENNQKLQAIEGNSILSTISIYYLLKRRDGYKKNFIVKD